MVKQVTTIIPTQGRESLRLAVDSAIKQADVFNQILVVVDGDDQLRNKIAAGLPDSVQVVATGKASNGNVARNIGVERANSTYIAFLDDDDVWLEGKLRSQLESVPPVEEDWIATCSLETFGGQTGKIWPARLRKTGEDITEYLFNREQFKSRPKYLQVSTWIAPAHVFKRYPFDATLTIHQDFDWMIRRVKNDGVNLIQIPDVLCRYRVNPTASISANSKWKESEKWLLSVADLFTRRSRAEFLLLVTQAFAVRDLALFRSLQLVAEAMRIGGRPGIAALSVALARSGSAFVHTARRQVVLVSRPKKGRSLRD